VLSVLLKKVQHFSAVNKVIKYNLKIANFPASAGLFIYHVNISLNFTFIDPCIVIIYIYIYIGIQRDARMRSITV
jgi:hypothetical protein